MKVQYREGYAYGFKMALGEFFKDALEKEAFKTGDIIYDTPVVYYLEWKDALLYINYAFQVVSSEGDQITYDILVPSSKRDALTKREQVTTKVADFLLKLQNGLSLGSLVNADHKAMTDVASAKQVKKKLTAKMKKFPVEPRVKAEKPKASTKNKGVKKKDSKQQTLF